MIFKQLDLFYFLNYPTPAPHPLAPYLVMDNRNLKYMVFFEDRIMDNFDVKRDQLVESTVECDSVESLRKVLLEYIEYVRVGYPPEFRFSMEIQKYFAKNGLTYETDDSADDSDEIDGYHIYPTDTDENNIKILIDYISKQSTEHIYEFIKNFIEPRHSWVWQPTRMESKRIPIHNNRILIKILQGSWTEL